MDRREKTTFESFVVLDINSNHLNHILYFLFDMISRPTICYYSHVNLSTINNRGNGIGSNDNALSKQFIIYSKFACDAF